MNPSLMTRATAVGTGLKVLAESGIIRPYSPASPWPGWSARCGTGAPARPAGSRRWRCARPTGSGSSTSSGSLTFGELHRRSNALARALAERGVEEGDCVAVMCRNHRGFVDASVAAAKLGADILYLNTAFAGPQLVDVLEREQPAVVIHDEEFTELHRGGRRRAAR